MTWQDQPGSIPQRRRAPHEPGAPFRARSGPRQARQSFARSIRFGQIEAGEGHMATASTISENSRGRSQTMPSHDEAREGVGRESVFWVHPAHGMRGAKGDRFARAQCLGSRYAAQEVPTSDQPRLRFIRHRVGMRVRTSLLLSLIHISSPRDS